MAVLEALSLHAQFVEFEFHEARRNETGLGATDPRPLVMGTRVLGVGPVDVIVRLELRIGGDFHDGVAIVAVLCTYDDEVA